MALCEIDTTKLEHFFESIKAQDTSCLHPSGCDEQAIMAHSISKKRTLSLLKEDGHVVSVKKEYNFHPEYGLYMNSPFQKMGVAKQASIFTGMCNQHDKEIFVRLDGAQNDWNDPEYLFLTAYRGILLELNMYKNLLAIFGKQKIDISLNLLTQNYYSCHEKTDEYKRYWDQIFLSETPIWEEIVHTVVILDDIEPSIAASQLVSLDDIHPLYPPNMVISVIPETNRTAVIFSYTKEESDLVKKYLDKHLPSMEENKKFTSLLSRLLLQHCGNIMISPKFWYSISREKRIEIEDYFIYTYESNNHNHTAEHLNLFYR